MPRVKSYNDKLAARLVREAGRLLTSHGPAALTTRAVAAASGTSTSAVYALYGDKQGLVRAMYVEGFRRLRAALLEVPATDVPLADLLALGLGYREAARASPDLYELMFARPVPGFRPDPAAVAVADDAYEPLRSGVARCVAAGQLAGDVEAIAVHLWATVHGLVSLELHGWLGAEKGEPAHLFEAALRASARGYAVPAR